MKTATVTIKGSLYDHRVNHAIVDICHCAGYQLPWLNDDVTYKVGRGEVVLRIWPGFNEKNLTQANIRTIGRTWDLSITLDIEDDEEASQ